MSAADRVLELTWQLSKLRLVSWRFKLHSPGSVVSRKTSQVTSDEKLISTTHAIYQQWHAQKIFFVSSLKHVYFSSVIYFWSDKSIWVYRSAQSFFFSVGNIKARLIDSKNTTSALYASTMHFLGSLKSFLL